MENEIIWKALTVLFGLYSGVITWLMKTAWGKIEDTEREITGIKVNCSSCQAATLDGIRKLIDQRFDKIEELIDQRIEQGFTKLELTWVNDGRISPKRSKKDN